MNKVELSKYKGLGRVGIIRSCIGKVKISITDEELGGNVVKSARFIDFNKQMFQSFIFNCACGLCNAL